MTFAVKINESARFVVHAGTVAGAVKAAFAASDSLGDTQIGELESEPIVIEVRRVPPPVALHPRKKTA